MEIGDMVKYYVCNECLSGDRNIYCDRQCIKKEIHGFISSIHKPEKDDFDYDPNHPELKYRTRFKVDNFGPEPTIIFDDELTITSSVK